MTSRSTAATFYESRVDFPMKRDRDTIISSTNENGSSSGGHVDLEEPSTRSVRSRVPFFGPANNLTNIIIGVGVLALPYALKNVGIVLGTFLLFLVAALTLASYTLLLRTKHLVGHSSYESISLHLFGPKVSAFVKIIISLGTTASLIAYLTIVADSTIKLLGGKPGDADADSDASPSLLLVLLTQKKILLLFVMMIVMPLSLTKRIESLTWTSTVSIMPLFFLMVLLMDAVLENGISNDIVQFSNASLSLPNLFTALPICTFAFASQVGSIPIFREMEQQYGASQYDMLKVAVASIGASLTFYVLVGVLGLMTFGSSVQSNVVLSFDTSFAVDLLLVMMTISVMLGYPFTLFPCRDSLQALFFSSWRPSRELTLWTTLLIGCITYFIATFVSISPAVILSFIFLDFFHLDFLFFLGQTSLSSVLSLAGGFTATITGYILPSLFYLRASATQTQEGLDWLRVVAFVVLLVGVPAGFISTTITVSNFIHNSQTRSH